jgi:hypothetical protein
MCSVVYEELRIRITLMLIRILLIAKRCDSAAN